MILEQHMNKALVVAHPDDEVLWAGGTLLQHPKNWTIICCSMPRKDLPRVWKFQKVCDKLGIPFKIYPLLEYSDSHFTHLHEIDLSPFDLVATHNSIGEYGHPHHVAVHNHVIRTFRKSIYFFGYGLPISGAVYDYQLSEDSWQAKLDLLKTYDHTPDGHSLPLWQGLLKNYGTVFDLKREYFFV